MRAPTAGDNWTYSYEGSSSAKGSFTGSGVESMASDTLSTGPVIKDSTSTIFHYADSSVSTSSYSAWYTVGATSYGPAAFSSSTGSQLLVTNNTYLLPLNVTGTTAVGGVAKLSDASTRTYQWTVLRGEKITVPAGTFDCWVVSYTRTHSDGSSAVATLWVSPVVGNAVQVQEIDKNTDGSQVTWNSYLTATNVAH